MKKLLSILGAISLAGTSTTSLIACNKPTNNDNTHTSKTTDTSVSGILAGKWLGIVVPLDFRSSFVSDQKYYLIIRNQLNPGNYWKGTVTTDIGSGQLLVTDKLYI